MVAAGALVAEGSEVPPATLVVGAVPASFLQVRPVTPQELARVFAEGVRHYVDRAAVCRKESGQ